ncbi:hypothetical protein [Treponema sp. R80B11-R83G3]
MKNVFKIFGIIAMVAVMVSFTGCATNSSIGGTAEVHGWLSSLISSSTINILAQEGGEEVANFWVIIGTLDIGYKNYANKVKAAENRGKKITTVVTNYLVVAIIKAYAR